METGRDCKKDKLGLPGSQLLWGCKKCEILGAQMMKTYGRSGIYDIIARPQIGGFGGL
jgi:hypothetical protein